MAHDLFLLLSHAGNRRFLHLNSHCALKFLFNWIFLIKALVLRIDDSKVRREVLLPRLDVDAHLMVVFCLIFVRQKLAGDAFTNVVLGLLKYWVTEQTDKLLVCHVQVP